MSIRVDHDSVCRFMREFGEKYPCDPLEIAEGVRLLFARPAPRTFAAWVPAALREMADFIDSQREAEAPEPTREEAMVVDLAASHRRCQDIEAALLHLYNEVNGGAYWCEAMARITDRLMGMRSDGRSDPASQPQTPGGATEPAQDAGP